MKAAVAREHGGPAVLNFETNFPDPKPGEGDVIVAVKASSLNYHDVFTRRGMPGIKVPMPAIMGLDVAGEIAEVGPGVTGWKKGDRVLVDPINRVEGGLMGETVHGGLAELCKARAHQLMRACPAKLGQAAMDRLAHQAAFDAVDGVDHDTVAFLPAGHARPDLGDLAGYVEAHDGGHRHLDAGHAAAGEDVVVVEA